MKFRVLDLFAGSQSVKKALDLCGFDYEYKGLDIVGKNNERVDLSNLDEVSRWCKTTNFKPDFIGASPPCRTFSLILVCKGGNFYYEVKKDGYGKITPRTKNPTTSLTKLFVRNGLAKKDDNWVFQQAQRGILMAQNTLAVVNFFGCPFAIENPATSLIKYLFHKLPWVKTSYCVWGFDYRKNTTLWFRKEDFGTWEHGGGNGLPQCDHKGQRHTKTIGTNQKYKHQGTTTQKQINNYNETASVPPKLIKFILEKEHKRWLRKKFSQNLKKCGIN